MTHHPSEPLGAPGPGGLPTWRDRAITLAALGLTVLLGLAVLAAGTVAWREDRARTRGIETGEAILSVPAREPRIGVSVALEQYSDDASLRAALRKVRGLGVNTVRQVFAWSAIEPAPGDFRWDAWDHVLPIARAEGLHVVAVLEGSPRWARPAWDVGNPHSPPVDMDGYTAFAGAFAARYGGTIDAYQVWDQPNIAPYWGSGEVDPAAYVRMLRAASEAIRAADPGAIIVAGALAPNTESGGRNMSDVRYLREMYRLGAAPWFDVAGAKPYGFWSGPYDRRVDAGVLNMSRAILLREEMMLRGDGETPIWGMEAGWATLPAGWSGGGVPQGSDSELVQSERLSAAIERVQREWPWMGFLCLQHLEPVALADDPQWGYALLTPQGEPNAMYRAIQESLSGQTTAYPGTGADPSAVLRRINNFPLAEVQFWGTGLSLDVTPGVASGNVTATTVGRSGEITVDLSGRGGTVTVARGLPLGLHTAQLQGTPEQWPAIAAVHVTRAAVPWEVLLRVIATALVTAWCAVGGIRALAALPVVAAWYRVRGAAGRAPAALRWVLLGGAMLATLVPPAPIQRLVALAGYGVLAFVYPAESLIAAVAAIPLAPLTVSLGVGNFSITELTLLVAASAQAGNALVRPRAELRSRLQRARRAIHWGDVAVVALVVLALVAGLSAVYRREALREERVVVFESALLYGLVRGQSRTMRLRLLDACMVSGVGVALYALVRYPSAEGVIAADGVRRARAFYGSPNNLALVLERLLPVGLAVAIWGNTRWRRRLYGAGALLLGTVVLLTFSRGALLLGVPAAILVLAVRRGRKATALVLGALTGGLLLAVAVLGVARLGELANPGQGTAFLRVSLWRSAWDMIRDHPWLGVGPDNFLYYYGDYIRAGAEVDRWLSHPHNLVLDFWVRLGIGGVLLLAALVGRCWRDLRLRIGRLSPGDERAMAIGLAGALAAAVSHGMVDAFFFVPELAMGCMFALAWAAGGVYSGAPPRE